MKLTGIKRTLQEEPKPPKDFTMEHLEVETQKKEFELVPDKPMPVQIELPRLPVAREKISEHITLFFDDTYPQDPYNPILCNYKGLVRNVHPAVCQWHRDRRDPECQKCERYL